MLLIWAMGVWAWTGVLSIVVWAFSWLFLGSWAGSWVFVFAAVLVSCFSLPTRCELYLGTTLVNLLDRYILSFVVPKKSGQVNRIASQ